MKKWLLLLLLAITTCASPQVSYDRINFTADTPYTQRAGDFYLHGVHLFRPGIMQEALYALTAYCLNEPIKTRFEEIAFGAADSMTLAVPRDGHKIGAHANALTYDMTTPKLLIFRASHAADVTAITHEYTHLFKPKWKHSNEQFYDCIR